MAVDWSPPPRPSWKPGRSRWSRLEPAARQRIALVCVAAVAAGATLLLYQLFAAAPARHTLVITQATAPAAPPAGVAAPVAVNAPAAPVSANAAQPPIALGQVAATAVSLPRTADLLRPGAEATGRLDLSLDGAAVAMIAVASRYTVTTGCEPLFADVFALRGGVWQRLYSASDPAEAYGPLLPAPTPGGTGGCFPRLRLFASGPAVADRPPILLLAAEYADTTLRFTALGWDGAGATLTSVFDWRTGAAGRLLYTPGSDRAELSEAIAPPDLPATLQFAGDNGRLTQVISFASGSVSVTARRLAPNCDRGHVTPGSSAALADGSAALLVLDCFGGSHQAVALTPEIALEPAGITWQDIHDDDNIQLEFSSASLQPDDLASAMPEAASLTDYAADTRHRAGQRSTQSTAPRTTAPSSAAPRSPRPAATSTKSQSNGVGAGATKASGVQSAPIAPRSAPPVPLVTPPPAPRGLPGVAPPAPR